ncbi:FAD-dependent oxidoreductase [Aliikangiella coralliicola]|uniref:Kynurenine 3-monooxygenase n=1 Tax=Aliikangiella coralliicola TaxID=2592383 RepID=A0A545U7Y5_9GAMM|nr:NAD(P)/FAD-dependent oxidoreductase [Aliikangiella coralliicola]TQV85585.1 FAD-dependent monooxygenase [Aliikangiella coralliicola]
MSQQQKITLIGAGLVGSLCAVFLAKRGYQVEVFERRPDMRKDNISAGRSINLALANRGIYPLQQVGLMNQVNKMVTPMKGRMIHSLNGEQNLQPYGQRAEEVIYSVSRADLNKLCMDAAEEKGNVTIHFNHRCLDVDFEKNLLLIKNELTGEEYQHPFERVIGTDGSASAVRDAIHKVNSTSNRVEPLGHSYKELCIPALNGDFQMDPNALHVWPRGGYMLIALPNMDCSFTVTLFMPNEGDISFKEINTEEKLLKFFNSHFPDAVPLLPNITQDYFDNPTGNLATVRCTPWHYQDKALLIGDAAHAVVPFHGQGMNCGFEDVSEFDAQIEKWGSDWQNVFSETDRLRKPNGDAIADMAIENYITMRDSVRDEKFLLRSALAFELEKRYPEYFCPRYSLVMFHRLPYAEAQQRGEIQEQILCQLTESVSDISDIDFSKAESLITEKLSQVTLNP